MYSRAAWIAAVALARLAAEAGRQADEAFDVIAKQGLVDAGIVVEPLQVAA